MGQVVGYSKGRKHGNENALAGRQKFRLYLVSSKLRLMNYLKKQLSSQLVL